MIEYVKSFEFTSTVALLIYWTPMAICLGVYFVKIVRMYRADIQKRESRKYYSPTLTVGGILWMFLVSVTPGVNLFGLIFDCMADVFRWFGTVLEIPLVRGRKEQQ